jgi:hypothetical protein
LQTARGVAVSPAHDCFFTKQALCPVEIAC